MTQRPLRKCKKGGCISVTRNGYCDEHIEYGEKLKANRSRRYDKSKRRHEDNEKYYDFYHGKQWVAMSAAIKRRDKYLCQMCLPLKRFSNADVTDHKVELKDDWSKRLDPTNLWSLCHGCHAIKTAEEKRKRKL